MTYENELKRAYELASEWESIEWYGDRERADEIYKEIGIILANNDIDGEMGYWDGEEPWDEYEGIRIEDSHYYRHK